MSACAPARRRVGWGPLAGLAGLGSALLAGYAAGEAVARALGLSAMATHLVMLPFLFGAYLAAVRLAPAARPPWGTAAAVLALGLAFRVVMLSTPVYLSSDPFRYLWDGRVQLAGISPYRYAPAAPELAGLRDADVYPQINRPAARTVYPPGAQWLFALAAAALPPTISGWRLLLLAADAATAVLLLGWMRRIGAPPAAVVAWAWAPLGVFEGVQAAHLEAAMVPFVLLALTLRARGAPVAAGVALGAAALVKLYPLLFVPVWWRRGERRFPAAVAATVALGYLPYALVHGPGALGFLPEYFGRSEDHNVGLRALLEWAVGLMTGGGELPRALAMAACSAALVAVLVGIGHGRGEGPAALWRASALAAGAYLLLVPTSMHPWYVMLIVPFLCGAPRAPWLYFSGAVSLSYAKYLVEPAPFPWWVWTAQYPPLFALLIVAWRRGPGARPVVRVAPSAA